MRQYIQSISINKFNPTARFEMNRLENRNSLSTNPPLAAPPYEFSQTDRACDIYFNMHGIPKSGIRVCFAPETQKFTVFAEREKENFTDQFLWVFSMPIDIDMASVKTRYESGAVQIHFAKVRVS